MKTKGKRMLIGCIALLVIALGAGTVYAAYYIARKNALPADAVVNFALVDAGVLPERAQVNDVDFEYDHGRFTYEIEFAADGTAYDYTIHAYTGEVLKKEAEPIPGYKKEEEVSEEEISEEEASEEEIEEELAPVEEEEEASKEEISEEVPEEESSAEETSEEESLEAEMQESEESEGSEELEPEPEAEPEPEPETVTYISVDEAKQIALSDAGVSSVSFTKAKLEKEDGRVIYEIEFYTGRTEYEYEIDAVSGQILERSTEMEEADDDDEDEDEDDDEDDDDDDD